MVRERDAQVICGAHPMVCGLINTYEDSKSMYILMNLEQGKELFEVLYRSESTKSGTAPVRHQAVLAFGRPALLAVWGGAWTAPTPNPPSPQTRLCRFACSPRRRVALCLCPEGMGRYSSPHFTLY